MAIGLFLCTQMQAIGQKKNIDVKYYIHKTNQAIHLDGLLNEDAWSKTMVAENFTMVLPMDTSKALIKTEVRMTYDDYNLYFIAVCYKNGDSIDMIESLKRDWAFGKNDNFIVFMDTYGDLNSGFAFGVNAAGAQWDGTMYDGGSVDLNWDNKWTTATTSDKNKYIIEAAIPFTSIRYKEGMMEWGINFSRNDLKSTEKSAWAPVPRQFPTASLSYTGVLVWDTPPPITKNNFSLIPYLKTSVSKDYTNAAGEKITQASIITKDAGLDAKISLSSSLNLDLTLHPDFSQVEVDRQVTNLSRFELFFPERRQFFLENADLFSNLGFPNTRPFFSRRIGLNAAIDFGARLSGRINKNWRMGLMDIKTSANDDIRLASQNFTVMALQRKLFKKSSIELFYIDRTALDFVGKTNETGGCNCVYKHDGNAFNRNIGFEYYLAPPNNTFSGKTIFIKSFTPNATGNDFLNAANFQYSQRKWILSWQHEIVGENYNAEVGYIPRNNYIKLNPSITRLFFPKSGTILSHGPQFTSTYYYNNNLLTTDYSNTLIYLITYRDKSTLSWIAQNTFVELLSPFDPTRIGKAPLEKGTQHKWTNIGLDWISAPQHLLTYSISTRIGGYYANGKLLSISGNVGYRIQPFVNIDFSSTYNHIQLPSPWGNNNFLLVGPKVDVTFSNKLFLTTFFQFNEQTKNINFNTRLQWRYKPVSDLFIVYTDNYYIGPVFVKNRALVLKFTYWWNK
ncbi:MAG: DUF5916 domain-containing protein [Sediminibacterium sp.]